MVQGRSMRTVTAEDAAAFALAIHPGSLFQPSLIVLQR
jgi:hypothetical protein